MSTGTPSPQDLAALNRARADLAEQQEVEHLLTETLDEEPPKSWRDLAKGALTQDG